MLPRTLFDNKCIAVLFYIGSGALFVWLFMQGPLLQPDSSSYIAGSPVRSPIYPLILKAYNWIFEGNYRTLVFLQLLFGYMSIHKLSGVFRETFQVSDLVTVIVFATLTLPYFYYSGQFVLSESVTYPIFLIFLSCFLQGFFDKGERNLIMSLILAGVLVMARNQFMFLYIFLGVVILYLYIMERQVKKTAMLMVALVSVFVSANLLERTYHYFNSASFSNVPFTGVVLIPNYLYLSKSSDDQIFEDKAERSFFQDIRKKIVDKGYIYEKKPSGVFMAQHLELVYDKIFYEVMGKHITKHLGDDPFKTDKILTSMSLKLIFHNFTDFIKLFLSKVIRGLGGYWFTILSLAGMLICLPKIFDSNNRLSIAYGALFGLTLLNLMLIGVVHYPLMRYTVYTQLPFICFLIILIEQVMVRKKTS